MKGKETLNFALRLLSISQKRALKKIATSNNNSINQEINVAINDHILNSQLAPEPKKVYSVHNDGDL